MKKSDALAHWRALPESDPMPHFEAIPYKSEGSSYGACGVRIDGSPEFVDAVLSRLKSLLAAEGIGTRLELTRKRVEARPGRPLTKASADAEVCYVRRHVRGHEGAMLQAFTTGCKSKRVARRQASELGMFMNARFSTAIMQIDNPIYQGKPNPVHGWFFLRGSVPETLVDKRWPTLAECEADLLAVGVERWQRPDCSWNDSETRGAA